jgi:hypothetical protein
VLQRTASVVKHKAASDEPRLAVLFRLVGPIVSTCTKPRPRERSIRDSRSHPGRPDSSKSSASLLHGPPPLAVMKPGNFIFLFGRSSAATVTVFAGACTGRAGISSRGTTIWGTWPAASDFTAALRPRVAGFTSLAGAFRAVRCAAETLATRPSSPPFGTPLADFSSLVFPDWCRLSSERVDGLSRLGSRLGANGDLGCGKILSLG